MTLELLVPPAVEPVTLAEAKAHLRVDVTDDDALLDSLLRTSRMQVESALSMALITQTWRCVLDCWPLGDVVELPLQPVASVVEIRVLDPSDAATVIDPVTYTVDLAGRPARIATRSGFWPVPGRRLAGIEIDLVAGFGAAPVDVPAPLRQAILMLVAHWYENREPATAGTPAAHVPAAVSALLEPYRLVQL